VKGQGGRGRGRGRGKGKTTTLAGDSGVFTFSIHAASNYPFDKEASDLDVDLADGAGDDEYLAALERGV
jgi:acetoin utilization deacetylase AcuC-like enzyme